MRNAQEVYDVIKAQLRERGINQTKMLNDLGISDSFMTGMKRGYMPRSNYLAQISKYLDISADYLLGITDDPQKKELLSDEKAILAMREIFIMNGSLKQGEPLKDWQIKAASEFLTSNAEMLRKLAKEYE